MRKWDTQKWNGFFTLILGLGICWDETPEYNLNYLKFPKCPVDRNYLEKHANKNNSMIQIFYWKRSLYFQEASCILVPGGFGDRGVSGMILAAKYARENSVPYLGICLGMQISVIEFARSVS